MNLTMGEDQMGQVTHAHVQYNRTDSVRKYDLRSVRTVKAVTNRKHLSYGYAIYEPYTLPYRPSTDIRTV